MTKYFALLTLVAACQKATPVQTVPESALPPETAEQRMGPTLPPAEETEPQPAEDIAAPPVAEAEPPSRDTAFVDPGADEPVAVQQVIAVLAPTDGNKVRGTVAFEVAADGAVTVVSDVTNLPPGPHAFHVHVYGDCSAADASSAGGHFDFTGSSFAPAEHVTGNLGELTGDREGKAHLSAPVDGATLQGKFSIVGRAVVIHEKGNDAMHPPDGAAGKRLACGVIGVREVKAVVAPVPFTP